VNAPAEQTRNIFVDLASVNVNAHTDKKGKLTYLSWVWALDQLMRRDPEATWHYPSPLTYGETMMVLCTVSAFGKHKTAQLPVMDHHNKAIKNPDAFAVNTAMQRCLVKAIALHGLGLYLYAGEDLPPDGDQAPAGPQSVEELDDKHKAIVQLLRDASLHGMKSLQAQWTALPAESADMLRGLVLDSLKDAARKADAERVDA
jgi:hypothetical protein